MLERLAEPDPRIDAELLDVDPRSHGGLDALAEEAAHLGDDVVVRRVVLHGLRLALHVHQHHAGAGLDDRREHRRVAAGRDVVHDRPRPPRARPARPRDLRVSTDTGTSGCSSTQPADHRDDAVRSPPRRARPPSPGRVDSPPTSSRSAPSATIWAACFTASSTPCVGAAVGEGVGCDVHDPHDQGALDCRRNRVRPAAPDRLVRHDRIVVRCTASRPTAGRRGLAHADVAHGLLARARVGAEQSAHR